MNTPTLFPEMEAEIREDRKAARREGRQRARDWLRDKDFVWLIDRLVDKGPQTQDELSFWLMEQNLSPEEFDRKVLHCFQGLWCFFLVGKLWRKSLGWHPGAGCENYLWGIRNVHPRPGTGNR